MYSFLRRPAWIVSHVLIVLLVACLIGLGFWQRSRYHEEKFKSEQLEERSKAEPVPLEQLVPSGAGFSDVDESLRYERVVIEGRWAPEDEVAIRNRSQNGAPGAWVLTPLVRDDGTAVAVVRGWIPYDPAGEEPPFPGSLPPEGRVTVTGNIQLTQRRGSVGAVDPAVGRLDALSRVDIERFQKQLDVDLAPLWVLLDGQQPAQAGDLPQRVDLQTQDPSQNFSYMIQWWIFAAIAVGGYPLVLRAVARSRARGDKVPDDDDVLDEPGAAHAAGEPRARAGAADVDVHGR